MDDGGCSTESAGAGLVRKFGLVRGGGRWMVRDICIQLRSWMSRLQPRLAPPAMETSSRRSTRYYPAGLGGPIPGTHQTDLVPTQPQKKIQLSKFPAVASVVSSGGVLCVPGSDGAVAGVYEGPRPISAGHTRSSRLDGGLPRAWLQRGLAKSRGVEGGLELEKLAQIDAAVCQGADGELGRELGPLMREFVQC